MPPLPFACPWMRRLRPLRFAALASLASLASLAPPGAAADAPDRVYYGGKVITLDDAESIVPAFAVREGRILAVGDDEELLALAGPDTARIDLGGRTVIPGIIESHCHSIGAARAQLAGEYAEFRDFADLQEWIREHAATVPPGTWIETPRNEITRLAERRFPTPEELDAGTAEHPVLFISATKYVFNTLGWETLGIRGPEDSIPDGEIEFEDGRPVLLRGGVAFVRGRMPSPRPPDAEAVREKHEELVAIYNSLGITTIFERATDRAGFDFFRSQARDGRLGVRVRGTFRFSARDAESVETYIDRLGLAPGEGDDMVRATCLKITVDGGIHWGTTWLREPHGERRTAFYRNTDPDYMGNQSYTEEQMVEVFGTVNRRGWPMSAHVTGDGGTMAVLRAVETVAREQPDILDRRFNLIHAYFPDPEIATLAKSVNAGVDTQGYLYYRDADFISKIYGPEWAERFIGLGEWVDAGVPVGLNSDHMIGFDPDHAMNSFNPFLMLQIAVTREDDHGNVHASCQRLSRLDALRSLTLWPAWLSFDEDRLGSIEPGKLADFAVLDRDYLECPEHEIRSIRPVLTVLGGETVFSGIDVGSL